MNPPRFQNPPLVYRMTAGFSPLPKRGIEATHKSIVNRLRRYSGESIVDLALHMLWHPPSGKLETLKTFPWLTLLLVKWALQDNMVRIRVGSRISQHEFDQLRQMVWDAPEKQNEKSNVWLMLRSILNVQIAFQRGPSWAFLRWPALYDRLDPKSRSRRQFREVIGMEPAEFLDLAYGMYATVLTDAMPLNPDWLAPFRPRYGSCVDKMYELFVRDLTGIRTELQADLAQRIRGKQELYEFPYLHRFPFIRLRDGDVYCWHPLVFARGLEEAVHLRLSSLGKEYVDDFSLVFEQYVTEVAMESGIPALTESAYKDLVGGHAHSVEVILEGENCNIFIEAKMSLFADDVMVQDSEIAIYQKTKRVREAIKQGWRVGKAVRNSESPLKNRFHTKEDYLLVVTSRELIIGNGESLLRLYPSNSFDYPDDDAKKRLPLSNVFIVSIEDFDVLMANVKAGTINLTKFLRDAVSDNQQSDTARLFFSDFIAKHSDKLEQPHALMQARRLAEERITSTIKG